MESREAWIVTWVDEPLTMVRIVPGASIFIEKPMEKSGAKMQFTLDTN